MVAKSAHHGAAVPTLLKPAFHQFTARTDPTPLWSMAKYSQQRKRLSFVSTIINPYFRQTLIGRQFARRTPEKLPLDSGTNALCSQPIHPQRCHEQIGGSYETWHAGYCVWSHAILLWHIAQSRQSQFIRSMSAPHLVRHSLEH